MSKFTNAIVINGEGKDIVFDGMDFSDKALIQITNANSITMKNCRVYNLKGSKPKSYFMQILGDIPVKLTVENCFFGDNVELATRKIYNLFELNGKLKNGSSFSNNYFKKGCCTHNQFGIYGVEDNAILDFNNNIFENCQAGIRLGMKGIPNCIVNANNNIVNEIKTEGEEQWEGLVTVQPYGKVTETFENVTINMNGNTLPTEQVIYMYIGKVDTELTVEQYPIAVVDGNQFEIPTYN